jgi:hypothetical protein
VRRPLGWLILGKYNLLYFDILIRSWHFLILRYLHSQLSSPCLWEIWHIGKSRVLEAQLSGFRTQVYVLLLGKSGVKHCSFLTFLPSVLWASEGGGWHNTPHFVPLCLTQHLSSTPTKKTKSLTEIWGWDTHSPNSPNTSSWKASASPPKPEPCRLSQDYFLFCLHCIGYLLIYNKLP